MLKLLALFVSVHVVLSLVILVIALGALSAALLLRYIPNNRVGIVEKLVSGKGSVKTGFIALNGEAGFQPDVLRGGWHVLTPLPYRVHHMPLVTIPQGKIGYVFARDGQPLPPTQTLAANAHGARFPGRRGIPRTAAASAARSARSCAKAPTRSTSRSSSSSPRRASTTCRSTGEDETLHAAWRSSSREREGFTPVVIKGTDDLDRHRHRARRPVAARRARSSRPIVGDDPTRPRDLPQQLPGPGAVPRAPAASAAASSRCSSRARTTSTASSRRSR